MDCADDGTNNLTLSAIRTRCYALKTLSIDIEDQISAASSTISSIACAVAGTLRSLPNLVEISLSPHFILHPTVWDCLQSMPLLKIITSNTSPKDFHTLNYENLQFHRDLSLTEFVCVIPYHVLLSLFIASHKQPELRVVGFQAFDYTTSHDLGDLIKAVARSAPNLSHFAVALDGLGHPWAFRDIAPLTTLSQLDMLYLRTDSQALLTDDNFATLAQSLPLLMDLNIASDPILSNNEVNPPSATMLALSHLARHCRHLRYIAVHVDARRRKLPNHCVPLNAFSEELETINFGFSPLDEAYAVALCLFRLVPGPKVTVVSGWALPFERLSLAPDVEARFDQSASDWEEVADALKETFDMLGASLQPASLEDRILTERDEERVC